MAAGDASHRTPVQSMHVLCCVILHKLIAVFIFDSCKSLTCYMVCMNYHMVQMFDGGNFDKFDKLKFHHQKFSYR